MIYSHTYLYWNPFLMLCLQYKVYLNALLMRMKMQKLIFLVSWGLLGYGKDVGLLSQGNGNDREW